MEIKPYPHYKPTGVDYLSNIPYHWDITRVKYVALFAYGDSLKSDIRDIESDIPVYGSNGIVDYHSAANTLAPCLIIGRKGSFGKINYSTVPCFAIDTTFYIDKNTSNANLRWLYYTLLSLGLDTYSQDSAVPGLSREFAHNQWLPKISIQEQQAIADFLDREIAVMDTLIAKKHALMARLQEKRTALISHVVTKGLDPAAPRQASGVEWLGDIPVGWEIHKLKHVAAIAFSNVDKHLRDEDKPVRLCNYTDVYYNNFITNDMELMPSTASSNEIRRFGLKKGDIIITKDSEFWDDIAVPALVIDELENVVCGYHLALIRPNGMRLDGRYLFRAFSTFGISDQYKMAANGITRYGLGKYDLDNSLFLIPPLSEQQAIADYLDHETAVIDTLIQKVEQAIERLQEYRTALISAAVTGKIDVRGGV